MLVSSSKVPLRTFTSRNSIQNVTGSDKLNSEDATKNVAFWAICVTLIVLAWSIAIALRISEQKAADYGEYFGSALNSITLAWLVAGFWLQQRQLSHSRDSLDANWRIHHHDTLVALKADFVDQLYNTAWQISEDLYLANEMESYSKSSFRNRYQLSFPISFLLAQPDLTERLRLQTESGNFVPGVHVTEFLDRYRQYNQFVERASTTEHESDPLRIALILGTQIFDLYQKLESAMEELSGFFADPPD